MVDCCCGNKEVLKQLRELKKLIYNSEYKTPLSGLEFFVSQNVHKLTSIRGYLILNSVGEEVIVSFQVLSDQSVRIKSNISLDDHVLILH